MIKLPEPAAVESTYGCTAKGLYRHHKHYYTANQLKQAIRDALEEAAKEFDKRAVLLDGGPAVGWYEPNEPAEIIRKLKEDMQ